MHKKFERLKLQAESNGNLYFAFLSVSISGLVLAISLYLSNVENLILIRNIILFSFVILLLGSFFYFWNIFRVYPQIREIVRDGRKKKLSWWQYFIQKESIIFLVYLVMLAMFIGIWIDFGVTQEDRSYGATTIRLEVFYEEETNNFSYISDFLWKHHFTDDAGLITFGLYSPESKIFKMEITFPSFMYYSNISIDGDLSYDTQILELTKYEGENFSKVVISNFSREITPDDIILIDYRMKLYPKGYYGLVHPESNLDINYHLYAIDFEMGLEFDCPSIPIQNIENTRVLFTDTNTNQVRVLFDQEEDNNNIVKAFALSCYAQRKLF